MLENRSIGCYMNLSNCSVEEIALVSQDKDGELVSFNQRLMGFLKPPRDSKYSLGLMADDTARLYISPNASPEAKRPIASVKTFSKYWNTFPSQISEPIYLKAGRYKQSALVFSYQITNNASDHATL